MNMQFIKQFGINKLNCSMKIPRAKHVIQIADIIKKLSTISGKEKLDIAIVQGDTILF